MANCPGCGAELVVQLERTEDDRIRGILRDELAMQPPVVVHDTIEVPIVVPDESPAEDAAEDLADAVEDLADEVDDLADAAAEDDTEDLVEDALDDELAALEDDEPEPEPQHAPSDDEPSRGHWASRKLFG